MSDGLKDLKKRLAEIAEAVRAKLPDIATTLTLSAKALAERQIKDQGFGFVYLQTRIPVWFLEGKELNQKGTTFLANKKKKDAKGTKTKDGVTTYPADYGTNWSELRNAEGLQIAHVDLSHTNKMWANMQPGKVEVAGNIVRAPLAATNVEAQNKMNWNFERYGDFVGKALTDESFEILGDVVTSEVVAVIEEFRT